MDKIDELLVYIQQTNPEMTKEKLIEELSVNDYSTISLIKDYLILKNIGALSYR